MNPSNLDLKKTPLYNRHVELGAKMVPFAGWIMPVKYTGVLEEHKFTRSEAGIFDICHMGEFSLKGGDVISFIQKMVTNDLNLLENEKSQYACMCYPNGTVVDDLIYYQVNPQEFIMIVNGANREKDYNWLKSHIEDMDVNISDISDQRSRLAFQGPKSEEYLQPLVKSNLKDLKRFYFIYDKLTITKESGDSSEIEVFLSRTGYTGEKGFEISCKNLDIIDLFNTLLNTGAKPIGLGARDSLRLEMAYSLYGHELSDKITPIEASIGWCVKPKDGIEYIGKPTLLSQKEKGTEKKLVGLELVDKGIMRNNYNVYDDDKEIGYITSGGYSPSLDKSIGLALINSQNATIGKEVGIKIRKQMKKAKIVKTPFYNPISK